MDVLVEEALQAIVDRDWEKLRPMLHPYLQWTRADGSTVRGRAKVLSMLGSSGPLAMPSSYELRDGQIYRWTV